MLAKFTKLKHLDLSYNERIKNVYSLLDLIQLEYLDLSSNKITNFNCLKKLKNLTILKMKSNKITEVSKGLEFENLIYLDLSSNNINDKISDPINKFNKLITLHLGFNEIKTLKINQNNSNLKELGLRYNMISDLTHFELPFTLEELDLSYNKIQRFNLKGNFSNLTSLILNNNQIEYFEQSSPILANLRYLNLNFNRVKNIDWLNQYINLQKLQLEVNEIEEIDSLSNLTQIQNIILNENKIKSPTNSIFKNNLIFNLNLADNNLDDLCWIKNLKYLVNLDLSNNKIKKLDCLLSSYLINSINIHLKHLDLSNNQISNISALKNFTSLTTLYLSNNKIDDLKPLSNLTELRYLEMNQNQINNLEFIRNMIKLKWLYLNENQIENISILKNLTNLMSLKLSKNKIIFLPNRLFENFVHLIRLDLSFNSIKRIDSFGAFLEKKLTVLDLSYNKIEDINFLFNFTAINELNMNNNLIKEIGALNFSLINHEKIDISNNDIILRNYSINHIGKHLKNIYIDANSIELFKNLKNDRIVKKNSIYSFYKSVFIIDPNQLYFVDCKLQLAFSKRMIHFNLFYLFQVQNFFSNCNNIFSL